MFGSTLKPSGIKGFTRFRPLEKLFHVKHFRTCVRVFRLRGGSYSLVLVVYGVGQTVFCRTKCRTNSVLSDKNYAFVGQIVGQTVFCRTNCRTNSILSDKWYNVVGQIGKGVSDK